jgi:hypothetical protein
MRLYLENTNTKLVEWLKWYSAWLASVRPQYYPNNHQKIKEGKLLYITNLRAILIHIHEEIVHFEQRQEKI